MRRAPLLFCLLWLGCVDDGEPTVEPEDGGVDAEAPRLDGEPPKPQPDMDAPDAAPDAAVAPEPDAAPPEIGWVEVTLDPRRALYALDETPVARAAVYDLYGERLEVEVEWSVAPPGRAEIGREGVVSFLGEGQGAVVACVRDDCGRAAFYVDAAPPTLVVSAPDRGQILGADGSESITVSGTATDSGGVVSVRVNGLRVELGPGGTFTLDLPARFGVNRVEVTADDGVRRPAVRDVRSVLWAPRYLEADIDRTVVPGALELRLDQALLDADIPFELPEGAGEVALVELAQVVEALLRLAEVDDLLGDPDVADSESFALRIESISLGAADVDLGLVGDGMELFLRLPAVEIETSGHLDVEGERIRLDGTLRAGLAAFVGMQMGLDDGLAITVGDVEVAVESIGGQFADPTAQVLVGTLGSRLQTVASDLALELVDGLIRDQLPELIEQGLGSLLGVFESIPLDLDTGLEGVPPVRLDLSLTASRIELRRREMMRLILDGEVRHDMVVAAPYDDPGVPLLSNDEGVAIPGEGLGVVVRLGLINGMLHALWRARLLQLEPPLPDALAGVLQDVRIDGRLPPVVTATDDLDLPLQVQVGDLRLTATGPLSGEPDVYSLDLRVGLAIRTLDGRIELEVAGDPDVQAVLIRQGGARPVLSADGLATLIGAAVWPLVSDALAGGLGFDLAPVEVDAADLAEFAPRLRSMTIGPRFVGNPRALQGRLMLEGGLGVRLVLDE